MITTERFTIGISLNEILLNFWCNQFKQVPEIAQNWEIFQNSMLSLHRIHQPNKNKWT